MDLLLQSLCPDFLARRPSYHPTTPALLMTLLYEAMNTCIGVIASVAVVGIAWFP
jgi:hypothetical protein